MPGAAAPVSARAPLLRGCEPEESAGDPERCAPSREEALRRCTALLCRLSASCQRFQLRPPGLPGGGSPRLPRGLPSACSKDSHHTLL
jgi:hypothetical protein